MFKFEYDKAFVNAIKMDKLSDSGYLHSTCMSWLDANLDKEDYSYYPFEFGTVVMKHIRFKREEDIVAFRLACGI